MTGRGRAAACAVLLILTQARGVNAAELKVLSSNGLKAVLEELVPLFEAATKHTVSVTFSVAAALKRDIESGTPFDLAVLTPTAIDDLIRAGRIAAGSRATIARSAFALGIRAGAVRPDIRTRPALERTLGESTSITHAREGAGGVFFNELVQRLGLADVVRPKVRLTTTGPEAAALVARGEIQLAVLPVSEIVSVPGLEVLGTFPEGLQGHVVMVAGASSTTMQGPAVKELIAFLTGPEALPVIKKRGMER